jgi:hypothetical protein
VAEGDLRYLEAHLTIDSRNSRDQPVDGWYVEATGRRGLGGEIFLPAHRTSNEPEAELIPESAYDTDILSGFLDVRRYNRVGPGSFLNLRGIFGGTLNDQPLPPEFQHAMGGVGSLPAYALFSVDCGARDVTRGYDVTVSDVTVRDPVYPSYGCDQIALFQAEFRGSLFLDWGFGGGGGGDVWEDDWDWAPRFELSPSWTAFFDMGRGWMANGLGDTDTLMDVGVGLMLGDFGIFYAYPLTEEPSGGRDGNFFIRLNRRF